MQSGRNFHKNPFAASPFPPPPAFTNAGEMIIMKKSY